MVKNLGVAISGGALALALASAACPAVAWGSALPAGMAMAGPARADPPAATWDSAAQLEHGPVIPPDPW
jgi:hypothetical protein